MPIYPVLLAIYPILHLAAANPGAVSWKDLAIAASCSAAVFGGASVLLAALVRDPRRGALLTAVIVVAFFSYGRVWDATAARDLAGVALVGQEFLLEAYAVALALLSGAVLLLRRRLLGAVTRTLRLFSAVLVCFALAAFVWSTLARDGGSGGGEGAGGEGAEPATPRVDSKDFSLDREEALSVVGRGALPDIYYIVLDGYARDDVLLADYGFDNTPFLDWLRSRGFYVAEESSPNYISTIESLASSLNFRYLEQARGEARPGRLSSIRSTLHDRIHDSELIRVLRTHGYRLVAFDSGLTSTTIRNAEVFLRPSYGLGEFHMELLGSTLLAPLLDLFERIHAARVEYTLGQLESLGGAPGPKLVFAHLLVPHPPYVFDAEGALVDDGLPFSFRQRRLPHDVYVRRYTDQVRFINDRMKRIVDAILAASRVPPVIVIQADHGPGFGAEGEQYLRERVRILNAYYLPGGGRSRLYPSVSPVNTFRVILAEYVGADLPLLPDGYVEDGRPRLFRR